MTENTMIMGFVILLIAIIVLCYMAKVSQEARDAKEEKSKPVAPLAVKSVSANVPANPVVSKTNQGDDEELIAVISAAIAAISGSDNVQVISIRSGGKAWVSAGRQDLMNEF